MFNLILSFSADVVLKLDIGFLVLVYFYKIINTMRLKLNQEIINQRINFMIKVYLN